MLRWSPRRRAQARTEVLAQPILRLLDAQPLAAGVVLDLVAPQTPDREVARLRVRQVDPANGGSRGHRECLRQLEPDLLRSEEVEQLPLLGVIGAGGISERGPDPAEALGDELLARQLLLR